MYEEIAAMSPAHQTNPRAPSPKHHTLLDGRHSERTVYWSWWWWWEITAAGLSLLSTSLIVVLLFNINNRPLQSWALPIQPNSLLAILTTITKTSLLVPIAACISQLKWRHFLLRSRPLDHLQQFDEASRGPWGSATMIYSLLFQTRSLVVLFLAATTILALGIEPSAQQIISFKPREVKVANETVLTSRADAYFSRTWNTWTLNNDTRYSHAYPGLKSYSDGEKSQQRMKLKTTVYSAVAGSAPKPYYTCPRPAKRCVWDDFASLGICGRTRNVTASVSQNCTFTDNTSELSGSCDFWHPFRNKMLGNGSREPDPQNSDPITLSYSIGTEPSFQQISMFDSAILNTTASLRSIWTVKVSDPFTSFDGTRFRHFESYTSDLYWCDRSLKDVAATERGFSVGQVKTTAWAGLDGNVSIDDYSLKDSTATANTPSSPLSPPDYEYIYNTYDKPTYNISYQMEWRMPDAVDSMIGSGLALDGENRTWELLERGSVGEMQYGVSTIGFELSSYMLTHDLETVTRDVADGLTAFMLQPDGDNVEVEKVAGYMIYDETRIQVRWVWLLLPVFETVLACALLASIIFLTRGQPLLKNSAIALITYGLSDKDREGLIEVGIITQDKLEKRAESMMVQLAKDRPGSFRFTRIIHDNQSRDG
ncbi:hypothetical protein GGR51DRAFT_572717 [Nemania sp. FL0031]|nr:hypothetical protein GGR51DRAFT_572717 [Nemania sp. FL0031]